MKADVIILLKFGELSHLKKLLNEGEVYMNTIQWFKESDKKAIGDKFEGTTKVNNYKNGKMSFQLPHKSHELNYLKLQLRENLSGHVGNIYSTYAISTLLLKRKSLHRIDSRMSNFGSHCVIIKDVKKFLNDVTNKLQELGHEYSHNLVTYKNLHKNNHDLTLFHKSHLLSYQKEHRIIAWTKNNRPLKINIDPISSYADLYTSNEIIATTEVTKKRLPHKL